MRSPLVTPLTTLTTLLLFFACAAGDGPLDIPLDTDATRLDDLDIPSGDVEDALQGDTSPSDVSRLDAGEDPCDSCGVGSTCLFGICTTPCSPVEALASCQDALACLDACLPDSSFPACHGMCISYLGSPGLGEFQALAQCAVTKCQATDDAPWNTDCLDANCADEMAGCVWGCTLVSCNSLWSCVRGCAATTGSPGLSECRQACAREALTTAQVPLLRVFECGLPSCHEECDQLGDLACITCLEATAESSCADEWRLCQD